MYKKDFYFFNVKEVCTENYHLRISNHYRLALNDEDSSIIIDAELKKVIVAADLVKMKFQPLNGDKSIDIKFHVFSNIKRDWKIYDLVKLEKE